MFLIFYMFDKNLSVLRTFFYLPYGDKMYGDFLELKLRKKPNFCMKRQRLYYKWVNVIRTFEIIYSLQPDHPVPNLTSRLMSTMKHILPIHGIALYYFRSTGICFVFWQKSISFLHNFKKWQLSKLQAGRLCMNRENEKF